VSDTVALAVDFGSTYTKLRAIELTDGRLLATAQAPTTVNDGLLVGLHRGLADLAVAEASIDVCFGCSSAAGGLRIVAVGLVRALTAEAARLASLGAGGKIIRTYAGQLSRSDIREILELAPDLIVLAGGTDGGDARCIVGNASKLAVAPLSCPVIAAGNRAAADDVRDAFASSDIELVVVANVLPSLEVLEPEPCSAAIRDIFIRRITRAKGLAEAESYIGRGLIPTPAAVLQGITLLAEGPKGQPGLGELLGVDVGGATTDVYSVSRGEPTTPRTTMRGLPEPYVKRTVEGDLGVRINALSIVEVAGARQVLAGLAGTGLEPPSPEGISAEGYARGVAADVAMLPASAIEASLDAGLASAAALVAARRHAGRLELAMGPGGRYNIQYGKDLTEVAAVIGSGGVLSGRARSLADCARILGPIRFDDDAPQHLLPRDPAVYVDRDYVLFAAGLLSQAYPDAAFAVARSSQVQVTPAAG
jgi:uncharacterized protein (TIGR01319 family)